MNDRCHTSRWLDKVIMMYGISRFFKWIVYVCIYVSITFIEINLQSWVLRTFTFVCMCVCVCESFENVYQPRVPQHLIDYLSWYGVATISRLLKIIGLFCKRARLKRPYSAKETYNFREPTNRSHPICMHVCIYISIFIYVSMYLFVHMYVCIYLSMYVCMYVCMYICMYVCRMNVRMYVSNSYMYLCIYLSMYVSI